MPTTGKIRKEFKGRLKRLDESFYIGHSYVHWTMTMQGRKTGWLDSSHHAAVRQSLFHSLIRYGLCCPVYCLMPDHGHFVFIGISERSRQKPAVREFRSEWSRILDPFVLQRQAYDAVLRETDRHRDRFAEVVGYILRNPVRKGLVEDWRDWPFSGAAFPGYPLLDPRKHYFWDNFWKAYLEQSGG